MTMSKTRNAPPCRFHFFHIIELLLCGDDGKEKLTKIRRRGKEVAHTPRIVKTTERNQFGLVDVERPQPFRSASSDVGLAVLRCNNDMKYMPRGFADARDLADLFRCDASQLAACFRALKGTMLARAAVRRMAFSVVALHVAANVVD